ncbi:MAG: MFS transporter [Alphaproteobacteria bacterium PA4]|nr:MAG: MFS transporter [Alphaproteobacteria bacterium PA4]
MQTDDKPAADLWGQPRGLAVLGATQFWESFSLYGLQGLLTLYMVGALFLPGRFEGVIGLAATRAAIESVTGPLTTQGFAVQLFGLWAGLSRFTPVLGGLLGDRLLGRRRSITLGCLLMTAGHFCMAFDASFLIALLLLMLGTGCANSNLFSQLGSLYPAGDRRRDDGLQIYYFMLNFGAFVAPIVCGWLGVALGWHTAFAVAGVGMLIGLLIYTLGSRQLPADPPRAVRAARAALTPQDWRAVRLLLLVMLVQALFWVAQSQVWNVYNLWVRDHLDRVILGWEMPIPWLQALDAIAPGLLLAPTLWLWRWQARRGGEPDAITKMAIGCLIFGAGVVWLALATVMYGDSPVPLLWAVTFHLLSNWGWIFFVPIAVGLYARAAPASLNAMMIGVNSCAVFVGSTISGRIGGLYEVWDASRFWLLHAGIISGGALLLLLVRPAVRRRLAEVDATT